MKIIYSIAVLLLSATIAQGQLTVKDSAGKKKSISINLGSEETNDTSSKMFDVHIGILDLGFNNVVDKTDYNSIAAQHFMQQVDPSLRNENLLSLREGKSLNVNIYPVLLKARLLKAKKQRIYASIGVGLQMYNFRYTKPITFTNEIEPAVKMDTVLFSKNKVGLTYLSVPLMVTMKTKLAKDIWLVYGLGITGGYRLSSWTKQVSDERGKEKNHDKFNFNNFNTCITGEIGLDGYIRLYASYQLTSLQENALEQYPYAIGVRFLGI